PCVSTLSLHDALPIFWIVDAHHLARALHDEGVEYVLVREIADLSALPGRAFRTFMDSRGWLHPYDPQGRRLDARKDRRSRAPARSEEHTSELQSRRDL